MTTETYILGLESSCDETSCAVVADGRRVLSNVVATQIDLHARFGGVVPEIASRAHIEAVNTVIEQALLRANVTPGQIHAVAVTCEPGLIGSLLIGLMAAKTLAWAWDVPLVGINHVYAHAYAAALNAEPIDYPAVALIASGGHTALYRLAGPLEMELLGTTIDDAAGEAYDKVASILRLGFPGGPALEKTAREGNPAAIDFPRTLLEGQSLDFSFSGLKTAVLYHVNGTPEHPKRRRERSTGILPVSRMGVSPMQRQPSDETSTSQPNANETATPCAKHGQDARETHGRDARATPDAGETPASRGIERFSPAQVADIAASFQAAVIDVLRIKMRRAVKLTGAKTLIMGGGVVANKALRAAADDLAASLRCTLRVPDFQFCVDNGAMIAGLGYHYLRQGRTADLDLEAQATVRR